MPFSAVAAASVICYVQREPAFTRLSIFHAPIRYASGPSATLLRVTPLFEQRHTAIESIGVNVLPLMFVSMPPFMKSVKSRHAFAPVTYTGATAVVIFAILRGRYSSMHHSDAAALYADA